MNAKLIIANDYDEELFRELSEKASKDLEKNHNIVISFPYAIPTMAASFLEQLLDEANGWNLLVRKDEFNNIVISKEAPQNHGYDNLLTLKKPGEPTT
jgi:hypothetical protein